MFYELIYGQLNMPPSLSLKILDFGSGLGVLADYYAARHDVTAVEPSAEMIENSFRENGYLQIHGGIEKLMDFDESMFDLVICHDVLEYVEDKEPYVAGLLRALKPGGTLSVVKHNRAGRVFQSAVFWNNPAKAILLLDERATDKNNFLGEQYLYSNDELEAIAVRYGGRIQKVMGIRTFFALGQDNSVRYTDKWYRDMLALELQVAEIDEYRRVAHYNHLLINKSDVK